MEYGGCFKRYTAPLMRSAVLGRADDQIRRIEDAVKATTQAMIDNIRPGRTAHDIALVAKHAHRDVDDCCWHSGAYGYTSGGGYPPTWAETIGFLAEGVDEELMPGMTFHLPSALRIPGQCGVSLSESVLVTSSGCEMLTDHPRSLHTIEV